MRSSGRRKRSLKRPSVTIRDFVAELALLSYRADCVVRLRRRDLGDVLHADSDGTGDEAIRVVMLMDSIEAGFDCIRSKVCR